MFSNTHGWGEAFNFVSRWYDHHQGSVIWAPQWQLPDMFCNCRDQPNYSVADQGVILMVRSLTLNWKQVINYVFWNHNVSASSSGELITWSLYAIHQSGLIVKCTVMYQESSHWKWLMFYHFCKFQTKNCLFFFSARPFENTKFHVCTG